MCHSQILLLVVAMCVCMYVTLAVYWVLRHFWQLTYVLILVLLLLTHNFMPNVNIHHRHCKAAAIHKSAIMSSVSPIALLFLLNLIGSSVALSSVQTASDYLSSLAGAKPMLFSPSAMPPTPDPEEPVSTTFTHAPISYFTYDKLTPKGPRANADVGQPHDATRPLVTEGSISAGTWWCAAGGWPSPAQRPTTEIFLVFSGQGSVTDLDGTNHPFGPGDTVVLPKGWSGRWDIAQDIHKVWFVHDHPNIEETSTPIRALIAPYGDLVPEYQNPLNALARTEPTRSIYNVGPTAVSSSTLTAGSYTVNNPTTECFHVVEGVFFLTNAVDGSAQRCVAGDTVVLPKGWSGQYDVIETVRKLSVVV